MLDRVIHNISLGLFATFLATIAIFGLYLVGCADSPADLIERATWKQVAPPRQGMECWRRIGERATMCVWSDGE
jgi:hypothetical protein